MNLWHPDTCDCRVWLGADGEPHSYEFRCAVHKVAPASDTIARNRAKNLAVAQVRARPGGSDADQPLIEFDAAGNAKATHIDFLAGRMTVKTVAPLTKEQFAAAISAIKGA